MRMGFTSIECLEDLAASSESHVSSRRSFFKDWLFYGFPRVSIYVTPVSNCFNLLNLITRSLGEPFESMNPSLLQSLHMANWLVLRSKTAFPFPESSDK
jgi:hypothetical protein